MSILDSITVNNSAIKQGQGYTSILETFGSPQKQKQMQQSGQITAELTRLEQLQETLGHKMDLFPVKQEKPGAAAAAKHKQQKQRLENIMAA